ncbi:potassium/proton antiporter [Paludibacter sp. 221]|uniref:potassium/proton antiporter n=1 Tax=Paludibacter sp. 221 TaxID=2302939 RepID=UPI0013D6D558|nr:potassium/proton antiporter [Paludibacter sp. 221]NDV46455.1 potassium/proton antiporter [Paludibacter sp. 221]
MDISIEIFLLVGSVLLFISLLVGKTGSRFGVPTLLLFLFIGVLAGTDGLGIQFDSPQIAQSIGVIALNIILFSGGMDTRYSEIKPVMWQGVILATVGVFLTALLTGFFIFWLTNNVIKAVSFSLVESFLLASVMSSTDSASVFGILRSRNTALKENLRPLLELESGSNDPMAYMLTIVLIQYIQTPEISGWAIALKFVQQFVLGGLLGLLIGKFAVRLINKINLANDALYSVLLLTIMFFIFGFTDFVGGNGYLAVYLGGLMIGNQRFVQKRSSLKFFDGLTWLFQIIMFLTLGLLVNPSELLPVAGISVLVGVFMILISRPISVFACLAPFRKMSMNARVFTSWVGLRGAVPIIFATYPWLAGVDGAKDIFNIVFFITILSLVIQGTSITSMAKWLKLATPLPKENKLKEFDIEFSDDIKSAMTEITVDEQMLENGDSLIDISLPDKALVVMVKRGENYFVPRGTTHLEPHDSILIITDNEETIKETYRQLGIDPPQ